MATRKKKQELTPAERGIRKITIEDVNKLEACFRLSMMTQFEKAFLDDFQRRFAVFGIKTTIFPKQEEILKQLYERTQFGKPPAPTISEAGSAPQSTESSPS